MAMLGTMASSGLNRAGWMVVKIIQTLSRGLALARTLVSTRQAIEGASSAVTLPLTKCFGTNPKV